VIPETQNTITGSFNIVRTLRIGGLLPLMLSAVEFDNELRFSACEINNEWTDKSLPPEMRVDQCDVVAKPLPKHALGIRWLGAHLTRKLSLTINHHARFNHICHRLWTPTPAPSPQGGGE
jgi:hypothetical protein